MLTVFWINYELNELSVKLQQLNWFRRLNILHTYQNFMGPPISLLQMKCGVLQVATKMQFGELTDAKIEWKWKWK